eukprot:272450_1
MSLLQMFGLLLTLIANKIVSETSIKPYGKWQRWGGNLKNQQKAMFASNEFNENKVSSALSSNSASYCSYDLGDAIPILRGFIAVDHRNNAIFATPTGFILNIDLDSCELIWSQNIAELLGFNSSETYITCDDSVTLYENENNEYSILFATTAAIRNFVIQYEKSYPKCYAVSISVINGSLQWILNLGTEYYENAGCIVHGFIIDNIYAYGGMSSIANSLSYNNHGFRGRMIKINLLTHLIENIWYSIPKNKSGKANESSYTGGSIWSFPAIINDYIIFGTGQTYSVPNYINNCFRNNSNINFDTH